MLSEIKALLRTLIDRELAGSSDAFYIQFDCGNEHLWLQTFTPEGRSIASKHLHCDEASMIAAIVGPLAKSWQISVDIDSAQRRAFFMVRLWRFKGPWPTLIVRGEWHSEELRVDCQRLGLEDRAWYFAALNALLGDSQSSEGAA